jgi:deoxyribonuclease-4
MGVLVGAHLSRRNILKEVAATGAEVAQVSIGNTRSWAPPRLTDEELAFWPAYELPVYVHASYLANPASSNAEVRAKTALALSQQLAAAEAIGARGVVVHGGHASGETVAAAVSHWATTLTEVEFTSVPLLIENTAGGTAAAGRTLEGLQRLWETVGGYNVGLCVDTCHAWAGNLLTPGAPPEEAFPELLEKLRASGIPLRLLHLNGSQDEQGSGRDRHTNLTQSKFSLTSAAQLLHAAEVPGILETPGPLPKLREEFELLRTKAQSNSPATT